MAFNYQLIQCQNPPNTQNTNREFIIVRCVFNNKHKDTQYYYSLAWDLAQKVNPRAANNATDERDRERLTIDALGGILAEYGWYYYINRIFGENTVNFTEYKQGESQIDLILSNGKTIEVRSSFPRNGVKFAICHERHNFKNICKYENLYKPSEIDKDFFASVLFETQKPQLKNANEIVFYLIGGSTKEMMQNDDISFISNLVAEDDLTQNLTKYKVIYLKDALDISDFENYMSSMGYVKTKDLALNVSF
jgi:hypothetical protein